MIKRDITALDKFLTKVRDANRSGLREVRIETRDAIDMATLIAQLLLDFNKPTINAKEEPAKTQLDGGIFKQ